jgi:hypothetical protein
MLPFIITQQKSASKKDLVICAVSITFAMA